MPETQEQIDYRNYLEGLKETLYKLECDCQGSLDKTVLSLSAGGLGVSFVFLKDILAGRTYDKASLITAWVMWALASLFVLLSYLASVFAFREGERRVNAALDMRPAAKPKHPLGGWWDTVIGVTNMLGVGCFVAGLISMVWFVGVAL